MSISSLFCTFLFKIILFELMGNNCRTLVYDLDSELPFPTYFHKYVTETFRTDAILNPEYHRQFRVVPAKLFLHNFASDRRHMRKGTETFFIHSFYKLQLFLMIIYFWWWMGWWRFLLQRMEVGWSLPPTILPSPVPRAAAPTILRSIFPWKQRLVLVTCSAWQSLSRSFIWILEWLPGELLQ